MKLKVLCALAVIAAMASFMPKTAVADNTPPSYCSPCLFYGGDLNPSNPNANGVANEMDRIVAHSVIYTPFVVPTGTTWNVTGLFTDNLMSISALSADWEIRSGVSLGVGGALLFSGSTSSPVVTDTGISDFGYENFAVAAHGLSGIELPAGDYWLSVVPVCLDASNSRCAGRSFQSGTDGANAFGLAEPPNDSFWNSSYFNMNFELVNPQSLGQPIDPTISGGVIGSVVNTGRTPTPEPSSLILLGTGLLGLGVAARRRHGKWMFRMAQGHTPTIPSFHVGGGTEIVQSFAFRTLQLLFSSTRKSRRVLTTKLCATSCTAPPGEVGNARKAAEF